MADAPAWMEMANHLSHLKKNTPLLMRVAGLPVFFQSFLQGRLGKLELPDVFHVRGFEAEDVPFLGRLPRPIFEDAPRIVEGPPCSFEVRREPPGIAEGRPGMGAQVSHALFPDPRRIETLGDEDR